MARPKDMLDFFRRAATPEAADAPPLEPTTRMLVLRRSQAIVAAAGAVAALLLAFLLGRAVGAAPGAPPDVYVIRAASYTDDAQARRAKEQLERLNLGDEVGLYRVPSENRTVVTVGAWLGSPDRSEVACALRDRLRGVKDDAQRTPFRDADFWRMRR